jgi:hypothetical protein
MNEKLARELKSVFDSTKTLVTNNLVSAVNSGKIKNVDKNSLEPLLSLIGATIDQSFFQTNGVFLRVVSDTVQQELQQTVVEKSTKKK